MKKIMKQIRFKIISLFIFFFSILGWGLIYQSPVLAVDDSTDEDIVKITQIDKEIFVIVNQPSGSFTWHWAKNINPENCRANNNIETQLTAELIFDIKKPVTVQIQDDNLPQNYCFKITDSDQEIDIWQSFQALPIDEITDTTPPTIILYPNESQKTILMATVRDPDLDTKSWYYYQFEQKTNCQSPSIANRYINLPHIGITQQVTLREESSGQWLCFKVSDKNKNIGYATYQIPELDTVAPIINISQNNRLLTAQAAAGETVSNWSYVFSPNDLNCDAENFKNNQTLVKSNQVTLTNDHVNYYYCFRASDETGNFGYVKYKVMSIDFALPQITLEQEGLKIILKSDKTIKNWQYLKTDANFNCGQQTNFQTAINLQDESEIILTTDDNKYYFCVKGLNATNTAGYAKLRVDTQSPIVILKQSSTNLEARGLEKNLTNWEYIKSKDEPNCNRNDAEKFNENNKSYKIGQTVELYKTDNDSWICFRAADHALNYGYKKHKITNVSRSNPNDASNSFWQNNLLMIIIPIILLSSGIIIFFVIKKRHQTKPNEEDVFTILNKTKTDDKNDE